MEISFTDKITVELIRSMGDDSAIAHAALVSTKGNAARGIDFFKDEPSKISGMINFLMKHRHGTPFEHAAATFFVHAPIFVWREWHRHRIGFCLSGDTEIWAESVSLNHGRTLRKRELRELYILRKYGVKDSVGRVRFLPSVYGQTLRVLNEETGFFQFGRINDIIESGVKELLLVEINHKKGYSVKCSKDHQILTKEGWMKAGDLVGNEYIAVSGKKSAFEARQIPPSLRAGIGVWTSMQRTSLIMDKGVCYICNKEFKSIDLVLDHVIPVVQDLKLALDVNNLKPACVFCHREKSNSEQILATRNNLAAARYVQLLKKPYLVSEEMTYDISMKAPHHNFVANGIVVHNSYNEESGRYKILDPIFYMPSMTRPMVKVDDWKPGRPKFQYIQDVLEDTGDQIQFYDEWCSRHQQTCMIAYETYLRNLKVEFRSKKTGIIRVINIDPGLARDCLPVGIYSSCWVTANPRSIMAFLSLRTYNETAKFVSYPLYEIEQAALVIEEIFKIGWPYTWEAFNKNGRVGP